MNKNCFLLLALLLVCFSCSKVSQQQSAKVSYCSPDSMVNISAEIQTFDNNPVLNDSILEFIEQNFRGFKDYYASSGDAQDAFAKAGEGLWKTLKAEIAEMRAGMEADNEEELPDHLFAWEYQDELTVEDITDKYITYINSGYEYQGGAHGMSWAVGTTFNRATGKIVTGAVLKDTESAGFQTLLREGLEKHFENEDGEAMALSDILFSDPDEEPIPVGNIRFTKGTVVIQYQQYEIAPYAFGMPGAVLTFDQVKPYLTAEGLQLIE